MPEAEIAEAAQRLGLERLEEQPSHQMLRVIDVGVIDRIGLGSAVEDADHVMDDSARNVAPQLNADVARAGQVLIEPALEQRKIGVVLQAFQADRCLVFADAQAQPFPGVHIEVRIEDRHRAGELRQQSVVDDREQRPSRGKDENDE